MFNVGGAELFVILLLALVVLGPDKLPGAMRTVGQWAGEMRKMANGFQDEMNKAIKDPLDTKGADKAGSKTTAAKAGDAQPSSNGSSTDSASTNGAARAADDATTSSDEGSGDQPSTSA